MEAGYDSFAFFGESIVGVAHRFRFCQQNLHAKAFNRRNDSLRHFHAPVGASAENAYLGISFEQILYVV